MGQNLSRLTLIQNYQDRLARLEDERYHTPSGPAYPRYDEINAEMSQLRKLLQDVMNNVCPVIKAGK